MDLNYRFIIPLINLSIVFKFLTGRQNAYEALKKEYESYKKMSIDHPFHDYLTTSKERKDVFVELATVKANKMEKHFSSDNDMQFQRQLEHFEHTSIAKEKILKKDDSIFSQQKMISFLKN